MVRHNNQGPSIHDKLTALNKNAPDKHETAVRMLPLRLWERWLVIGGEMSNPVNVVYF